MKTTYIQRLGTFGRWPHSIPSASDMAAAGFTYTGDGNDATCSDCKAELTNWVVGDVPLKEHASISPDCPFVLSQQKPPPVARGQTNQSQQRQKSPEFSFPEVKMTYDQRLATFTSWPHSHPSASNMAAAGFSQEPSGRYQDMVKCSDCPSRLFNWVEEDVPLETHNPNCQYVLDQQRQGTSLTLKSTITQAAREVLPQFPAPIPLAVPTAIEAIPAQATITSTPSSAARNRYQWITETLAYLLHLNTDAPVLTTTFRKNHLYLWQVYQDISLENREVLDRTLGDIYNAHGALDVSIECYDREGRLWINFHDATTWTRKAVILTNVRPKFQAAKAVVTRTNAPTAAVEAVETRKPQGLNKLYEMEKQADASSVAPATIENSEAQMPQRLARPHEIADDLVGDDWIEIEEEGDGKAEDSDDRDEWVRI